LAIAAIGHEGVAIGHKLFVCDNLIDEMMMKRVSAPVRTLHYAPKEKPSWNIWPCGTVK
jgi:hypothetical protein